MNRSIILLIILMILISVIMLCDSNQEIKLISKRVFVEPPENGVCVSAGTINYITLSGTTMLHTFSVSHRSDTADRAYRRWSYDNGETWTEPDTIQTGFPFLNGARRVYSTSLYLDPHTGRLFEFFIIGNLSNDDPLDGLRKWVIHYRISVDGGKTFDEVRPVLHKGAEFTQEHPLPNVWTGKNSAMNPCCRPITTQSGEILLACQISPLDAKGNLYNPTGGYTYHYTAVLIGKWCIDKNDLEWTLSDSIQNKPEKSTRGAIEGTIADLENGNILLIMRGSNDSKPRLPGHKWMSFSTDNGHTWTDPVPWSFTDGQPFYSPSSCSYLVRHGRTKKLYWFGNISEDNPHGNSPRYPLVIVEVDEKKLTLKRESLLVIDTRRESDGEKLQLSNFAVYEDRISGEFVVICNRWGQDASDPWHSPSYIYRIQVH